MNPRPPRWHAPLQATAALLALLLPGIGCAPGARAAELQGTATLTSDYVWRGSSQTLGDPAAQAGIRVVGGSGVYASAWGSNVKFAPDAGARHELDLGLGWSGALARDWTADVGLLRYRYPGNRAGLDWSELDATLTWKSRYWMTLAHSRRALGTAAVGTYAQFGAKWPLRPGFRIEAALARYWLDGSVLPVGGYAHAQLGAVWTLAAPLEFRLTAHATDGNAGRLFGGGNAGSRLEAALQASF